MLKRKINILQLMSSLAAIAILASFEELAFAQNDSESKECVRGQYIMDASVPALRKKAEITLEEASTADFQAVDEYREHGIVLLEDRRQLKDGVGDASDSEVLPKARNACEKMKKKRRADILHARSNGKFNINSMRNYDCNCNQVYHESDITPNDSMYDQLWGMKSTGYGIGASKAWEKTTGTSQTIVAVIDTGVDYNHPDLIQNLWTNSGEIPGNGIDDDGNGYVDDYRGWNAITSNGDPMDDVGHGTHCSGTIGARGNNSIGVPGVNWNIKIIPVKFLGANGGTSFDAVKAIDYVTALKHHGVNVILSSNSWGGTGSDSYIYSAIVRAKAEGLLFVAAAGNNGQNIDSVAAYPAGYDLDNIISVAAIDSSGQLTSWSNYGATKVDVAAPGNGIVSTYLTWQYGGYATLSGTSMATPHVSGALALLSSYNPNLTWTQLRDNLFNTGISLPSLQGKVVTGKEINVAAMINAAYAPGQTPVPTSTPTNTPTPFPTNTPTLVPSPTATATPTSTPTPGWYAVSGKINKVSDGAGLGGVRVVLKYGLNEFTAISDANGNYSFANIQGPITYTVKATYTGYSFETKSVYVSTNQTVDFDGSANSYHLSGQVISGNKSPVAGITISLNDENRDPVLTDSQGKFSFDVPAGMNYVLKANSIDYVFDLSERRGTIFGDVKRIFVAKPD